MNFFEIRRAKFSILLTHLKTKIKFRERLSILRKGRVLALASFQSDDESKIINNFNKNYETSLMIPIVYNPNEDMELMNEAVKSYIIF